MSWPRTAWSEARRCRQPRCPESRPAARRRCRRVDRGSERFDTAGHSWTWVRRASSVHRRSRTGACPSPPARQGYISPIEFAQGTISAGQESSSAHCASPEGATSRGIECGQVDAMRSSRRRRPGRRNQFAIRRMTRSCSSVPSRNFRHCDPVTVDAIDIRECIPLGGSCPGNRHSNDTASGPDCGRRDPGTSEHVRPPIGGPLAVG